MKKILLSSVALLGLTAGAFAADLPARRAAPMAPPIAAVPFFTWTGFYVGVNAGAGWNTNDDDRTFDVFSPAPANVFLGTVTFRNDDEVGFVGGGQIGYNVQFGSFVVGLEADLQYADLGGNGSATLSPGLVAAGFDPNLRGNGVDWFGTVRGRAGFAFDRVLIYATGGFAYGEGDNGDNGLFNDDDDDIRTGWVVGGGVEWALPTTWNFFGTSAATFGVEGLFVSLDRGDQNVIGTLPAAGGGRTPVVVTNGDDDENEFAVVRAKLNFKF